MHFPLAVSPSIELRPLTLDDAPVLFQTLEANRHHLDQWLRWSGRLKTLADVQSYITRFALKLEQDDGFHAGMWQGEMLIGGIVCHFINHESKKTEIGYWLTSAAVGRGLVNTACKSVITELFQEHQMHRIEIQCATDNLKSKAVAERLGFTLEGIKRESEWLTSRFADHAMYALIEGD